MLNSDIFMIRDDCQFVRTHKYPDGKRKTSYQSHTPTKQLEGIRLLSVSIKHEGLTPLNNTHIMYKIDWIQEHLNLLKINYVKAKNFNTIFPEIKKILTSRFETLSKLNSTTIIWAILHLLKIPFVGIEQCSLNYINGILAKQKTFRLRQLKLASKTKSVKSFNKMSANEKIVTLCKEVGASEDYCGGTAMSAYVDEDIFKKNGIAITVQDWKCKVYEQQFEKQGEFIPNLSIIDLLMNVSIDEAISIIRG